MYLAFLHKRASSGGFMSMMSEYSSSRRSFSLSRRSFIMAGSSLSCLSASCSKYSDRVVSRVFLVFRSAIKTSLASSLLINVLGKTLPSKCRACLWYQLHEVATSTGTREPPRSSQSICVNSAFSHFA